MKRKFAANWDDLVEDPKAMPLPKRKKPKVCRLKKQMLHNQLTLIFLTH